MGAKPRFDFSLTAFNEMFMNVEELAESKFPRINDILVDIIDDSSNYPFKVGLDEDMKLLVVNI